MIAYYKVYLWYVLLDSIAEPEVGSATIVDGGS